MPNEQLDDEAIYRVAREIASPEARASYLDQVCGGDQALRERVDALLAAHEQEQSGPNAAEPVVESTVDEQPSTEQVGTRIGRYALMEQIGEGGMGTVFVAQQQRPVRRKVALKVIKPGMDSKSVIARFEAERQALALMDHPNIAKVFDGGTTRSGRPYFVMELVRGEQITKYCDRKRFSIQQRLELFIDVCHAIQHAHQKAIIHRDIKPSNVLVTELDGRAVPKVIDFGVAKALNQNLTEQTIYTQFHSLVGTPLYMSPEQTRLSAIDVDTRSDVYSLGVLLYELLVGETPLDAERLKTADYAETQRLIQEEGPARPSTRLSSTSGVLSDRASRRNVTPEQLCRQLRGDLDWIVMKSLEKDRARRYQSAAELADDIDNYLSDQPINARPPSKLYRVKKFTIRNRGLVAGVACIVLMFVASFALVSRFALVANRQKALAQHELYERFLLEALMDPVQSEESIQRAIKYQLPHQQLALLRALDAFYREDYPRAREQLAMTEQGLISASISAIVEAVAGTEPGFTKAMMRLKELEPASPIEAALEAQLYSLVDPWKARDLLQRSGAASKSGMLGHLMYAQIESQIALLEGDMSRAEESIHKIDAVLQFRPDSKYVRSTAICVLLYHGANAELHGDTATASRSFQRAAELENRFAGEPGTLYARLGIYFRADDDLSAFKLIDRQIKGASNGAVGYHPLIYAPTAILAGKRDEALRTLEAIEADFPRCYVKLALAQLHIHAGNLRRAASLCDQVRRHQSGDARTHLLYTRLMTPGVTLAVVAAEARQLTVDAVETAHPFEAHLVFWANEGRDPETFRKASPRLANFDIGLLELARGNKSDAIHHFREQLKTSGLRSDTQDIWARYFLRSIEAESE